MGVDEHEVGQPQRHRVDGEVAAGEITGQSVPVSHSRLARVDLVLLGAVSRDLDDDTASACPDRAEVPADVPAGVAPRAQDLLGLLRSGRGRAVQIVGHDTQERVTYGSAHEGELVPGANEQVPQGR